MDDLYAGMEALAERHGVTVAGGDVTAGPALVLAIAAVGRPSAGVAPVHCAPAGAPATSSASPGPSGPRPPGCCCWSGPSWPGRSPARSRTGSGRPTCAPSRGSRRAARWRGPAPGRCWTSRTGSPSTRARLARASGARAVIELARLPLAEGVAEVAAAAGRDAAARWRRPAARTTSCWRRSRPAALGRPAGTRSCPLTPVGRLEEGPPGLVALDAAGAAVELEAGGWEHDV